MTERRKSPRLRSLRDGRIVLKPKWPVIDCTVRNLSSGGACLEVDGDFSASLEFELTFLRERSKRACRHVWRQGNRIGVSFR